MSPDNLTLMRETDATAVLHLLAGSFAHLPPHPTAYRVPAPGGTDPEPSMPVLAPPDPASVRTTVTVLGSAPPSLLQGIAGATTRGPAAGDGQLVEVSAAQAATLVSSGWATPWTPPASTGWGG